MKTKLSIGCGPNPRADQLGIDWQNYGRNDITVANLDVFPWPLPSNAFEHVEAHAILEHVSDLIATMKEIHRVLQPGGVLSIVVPYFTGPNTWDDPTHKRGFTTRTFKWWTGDVRGWYANEQWGGKYPFRMISQEIKISAALPWLDVIPKLTGGPVFDRVFAHLFAAQGLHVEMEKIPQSKPAA